MEEPKSNLIVRFFRYVGSMIGLMWDNSLIRLLKLIDYPRFHSLHFENLMTDYRRLRLGDPAFIPETGDKRSLGFLEIGRDYEQKFLSKRSGESSWTPNILDVLVFERVIVHFLPDSELKLRALYIQQRYKSLISEAAFDKLQSQMNFQSISDKTNCNLLRDELDFMLHDLTRGYIFAPLPYGARQNIWLYAFWFGSLVYASFFVMILFYNLFNTEKLPASMLLVPLFGSAGAFLSIKQRVEALPYGNDSYRNIILLNASMVGLIFGLVRGAAFAILLNILMISGLVDGELFPKYDFIELKEKTGLSHTFGFLVNLNQLPTDEISKILIWSLLAGFSERLVPDALKRLSDPKSNIYSNPALNTNQVAAQGSVQSTSIPDNFNSSDSLRKVPEPLSRPDESPKTT